MINYAYFLHFDLLLGHFTYMSQPLILLFSLVLVKVRILAQSFEPTMNKSCFLYPEAGYSVHIFRNMYWFGEYH